jgi:two-component system, sensor histidine kinase RegB
VPLSVLIEDIVAPHRSLDAFIEVKKEGVGPEPLCRRNPGVVFGLSNILDNAVDFASEKVVVEARWNTEEVRIEIRDDGPGYAPEVLLRVGEPYVTTRPATLRTEDGGGSGLGLGLFIAKTLIERSGAQLLLMNAAPPATGATARIVWARQAFERGAAARSQGGPGAPVNRGETVPI